MSGTPKFKIGEKVVCVDAYGTRLVLGDVYTVEEVNRNRSDEGFSVRVSGHAGTRFETRFIALEEARDIADIPSKEEWDRKAREKAWARGQTPVPVPEAKSEHKGEREGPDSSGIARAVRQRINDGIKSAFQLGTGGE